MLHGWYCRSLANEQAPQQISQADMNDGNDDSDIDSQNNGEHRGANASVDYKTQYRYLKQKLKFLIYENEFFQDALRSNQRRLLKVSRDKAFLLDRLLQYEKPENSSSDSDETEESSDDETQKELKKKKMEQTASSTAGGSGSTRGRKKKIPQTAPISAEVVKVDKPMTSQMASHIEPHFQEQHHQHQLSPAEVERQLSRRPIIDMMPERAPATVPAEMFSNEPSLDSEVNEQIIDGSTTHVAAEECVPMEYIN